MTITDIRQTVQYLDRTIGPTLTAYLTQSRRRDLVGLWKTGEASPNEQEAGRLAAAEKVLRRVAKEEGADTARAWFIGANTSIPGHQKQVSPAEAIRNDYLKQVERSADKLINDEWLD